MAASGNQDQENSCVELNEYSMVASMQEQLALCLDDCRKRSETSIFRVPSGIRQANKHDAFDPMIVSIGPYHYDNPRLQSMQEPKWRYLGKFISRNPAKGLSDYFGAIKSSISQARECYSEEIEMDDDHFVQILLLDGSFIIEYMLMRRNTPSQPSLVGYNEEPFDHLMDQMLTLAYTHGDLLKLENQIPFFVLQKLWNLAELHLEEEPSSEPLSIADLVLSIVPILSPDLVDKTIKRSSAIGEIKHLLHFYHSCCFAGRGERLMGGDIELIPTAQELKELGVKIRKKENGGFLEATFSKGEGVIEMTPVFIEDDFAGIFHNLIAFEQCCPRVGMYVTGYSLFLDCLINTSADVILLRQKGVVKSGLGSDKDLANLVNGLCYNVVLVLVPDSYGRLFTDVNSYCRSSWPRWRANLMHDYFRNPWAIISLVAAIILLFLAGLQAVFTMLSYVHTISRN